MWSSVWHSSAGYAGDIISFIYLHVSVIFVFFLKTFGMWGTKTWNQNLSPLFFFLSFLHTSFLFSPLCVLRLGHIMSTHVMCAKTMQNRHWHTVNSWLLRVSAPISLKEVQSPAHTTLLWLSSGQPACFPGPSCLSALWTVLQRKGPQSSRPPDGSPGGATLTTAQLHLSLSHSKPEPPTVALLLCRDAFYIMCASGAFHSGLFDYNHHMARRGVLFWIASWEPLWPLSHMLILSYCVELNIN